MTRHYFSRRRFAFKKDIGAGRSGQEDCEACRDASQLRAAFCGTFCAACFR
jgi:hypothetical protein